LQKGWRIGAATETKTPGTGVRKKSIKRVGEANGNTVFSGGFSQERELGMKTVNASGI